MEKKTLTEFIRYCFIGGCTTAINYLVYIGVLFFFQKHYLFANTAGMGICRSLCFLCKQTLCLSKNRKVR